MPAAWPIQSQCNDIHVSIETGSDFTEFGKSAPRPPRSPSGRTSEKDAYAEADLPGHPRNATREVTSSPRPRAPLRKVALARRVCRKVAPRSTGPKLQHGKLHDLKSPVRGLDCTDRGNLFSLGSNGASHHLHVRGTDRRERPQRMRYQLPNIDRSVSRACVPCQLRRPDELGGNPHL